MLFMLLYPREENNMNLANLPLQPSWCVITVAGKHYITLFNPFMRAFLTYSSGGFHEEHTIDTIDRWTLLHNIDLVPTTHFNGSVAHKKIIEKLVQAVDRLPPNKIISKEISDILVDVNA